MPRKSITQISVPATAPVGAAASRAWSRGGPLLIVVFGVLAYTPSFSGQFVFDDRHAIVDNVRIRSPWPLSESLFAEHESTLAGRPLVSLSFVLNYALGGADPWGYHAVNLLLHLSCALLLFGVVRHGLRSPGISARVSEASTTIACVTALLWVVHPLNSEAVAYVVQRTELMASLFTLLAMYAAIRRNEAAKPGAWSAVAAASCALGACCKESIAIVPLLIVIYDGIYRRESMGEAWRAGRRYYAALMGSWAILVLLNYGGPRSDSVGFSLGVGWFDYLKNQAAAIFTYLRLSMFPVGLAVDYGFPRPLSLGEVIAPALVVAFLLGLTGLLVVRRPKLAFPGIWFFLLLAPTSSVLPIITEVAAERRMYLPLAAVLLVIVLIVHAGLSRMGESASRRLVKQRVGTALTCLACLAMAFATRSRLAVYGDELKFWQSAIDVRPGNARAFFGYGETLSRMGKLEESIPYLQKAIELHPKYPQAHFNLGNYYLRKQRPQQAVESYNLALADYRGYADALLNRGAALAQMGRYDEALVDLKLVSELNPLSADARANMAAVYVQKNALSDAVMHMKEAVRISPGNPRLRAGLGGIMLMDSRFSEAIPHLREALRLAPGLLDARRNLCFALLDADLPEQSVNEFRAWLAIEPDNAEAKTGLARAEARLYAIPQGTGASTTTTAPAS